MVDVCEVMRGQAMKPGMGRFSTLISAGAKDTGLRRALDVCADMLRQRMKPNMVSHRALISA